MSFSEHLTLLERFADFYPPLLPPFTPSRLFKTFYQPNHVISASIHYHACPITCSFDTRPYITQQPSILLCLSSESLDSRLLSTLFRPQHVIGAFLQHHVCLITCFADLPLYITRLSWISYLLSSESLDPWLFSTLFRPEHAIGAFLQHHVCLITCFTDLPSNITRLLSILCLFSSESTIVWLFSTLFRPEHMISAFLQHLVCLITRSTDLSSYITRLLSILCLSSSELPDSRLCSTLYRLYYVLSAVLQQHFCLFTCFTDLSSYITRLPWSSCFLSSELTTFWLFSTSDLLKHAICAVYKTHSCQITCSKKPRLSSSQLVLILTFFSTESTTSWLFSTLDLLKHAICAVYKTHFCRITCFWESRLSSSQLVLILTFFSTESTTFWLFSTSDLLKHAICAIYKTHFCRITCSRKPRLSSSQLVLILTLLSTEFSTFWLFSTSDLLKHAICAVYKTHFCQITCFWESRLSSSQLVLIPTFFSTELLTFWLFSTLDFLNHAICAFYKTHLCQITCSRESRLSSSQLVPIPRLF